MIVQSIKIRRGKGWHEAPIEAQICGAFAIHPPSGTSRTTWKDCPIFTVTHLRTGYKVGDWPRKQAIRIARWVNNALPEGDFDELDFETPKYAAFVAWAKRIISDVTTGE